MIHFIIKITQGALVGLGSVLPGISGGVLSVVFGIYQPLMELLAEPKKNLRSHLPILFPYLLGAVIGFMGIANLLAFILGKYPAPSVCLFIGLISGMLPSLFKDAGKKGTDKNSYLSLSAAMAFVFILLTFLQLADLTVTPNFLSFLFCGFCLALSIIAPGMSFSTLLMPLGLYAPFVDGIGHMRLSVLLPGGIGAIVTILFLSRAVNLLFTHHYSVTFHAIVGIIIAATVMIIPFESFHSLRDSLTNGAFFMGGVIVALLFDRFNRKF